MVGSFLGFVVRVFFHCKDLRVLDKTRKGCYLYCYLFSTLVG